MKKKTKFEKYKYEIEDNLIPYELFKEIDKAKNLISKINDSIESEKAARDAIFSIGLKEKTPEKFAKRRISLSHPIFKELFEEYDKKVTEERMKLAMKLIGKKKKK